MWIKISVVVALFALLSWSAYKLFQASRRQKSLKRSFREPMLSAKNTVLEDEFVDDVRIIDRKIEPSLDDSDSILGLRTTATTAKRPATETAPVAAEALQKPKKLITLVIHLMAPKAKPYIGYELLQALLATGLRFGEHNIFHRHESKSGVGQVLFHMASVNAPGTFELSKMGAFSCPGLSFFMQLNEKIDNAAAFEVMLDTANELLNELGGELLDEQHKNLSLDRITEYRRRIRQYLQNEATRLPDFFEQFS